MSVVELEKVSKRYGDVVAVQDFNLTTSDGEFVVLVGPSGCGKTTTMRMIAGLELITQGSIKIGGRDVAGMIPRERDVAMVFQNYALFPHMDVFGNMAFGLRLRKLPKAQIENQVHRAAKILGIENLLSRKPKELSGGQRQRVALGRAIVREPKVFLMDEPLSNIDAKLRVEMRGEIIKLQRRLGVTTFYVTHDQVEAMSMGDRVVVMLDGRIQQVGAPRELYRRPANRYVAGFIGSPAMNFVRAQVGQDDTVSAGEDFRLFPPRSVMEGTRKLGLAEVWVGVRPEHLKIRREGEPASKNVIRGTVEVVEPQGSTTLIQLNASGDLRLNALLEEQLEPAVGARLDLWVGDDAVYVFNPSTDERIQ
jgi:multiple sugar transport system ATP-binding protein